MQTTKWGPSAWDLLHSIAQKYDDYPSKTKQKQYTTFFSNLQNVLPCKYCRFSLTDFYVDLPVENYVQGKKDLSKFVYLIHNRVNKKLLNQGYKVKSSPSLSSIRAKYNKSRYKGEIFMGCVVYNYPEKKPEPSIKRNISKLFNQLPNVLPNLEDRKKWKKYLQSKPIKNHLSSRTKLKKWYCMSPNGCKDNSFQNKFFESCRASSCSNNSCRK